MCKITYGQFVVFFIIIITIFDVKYTNKTFYSENQ